MRDSISPHFCQRMPLSFIQLFGILMKVMWYSVMVLIFISLMTNDVIGFSLCFLLLCIYLKKWPSNPLFPFYYLSYEFYCWDKNYFYILGIRPLSDTWFANVFPFSK
jgi:hypothetical protein